LHWLHRNTPVRAGDSKEISHLIHEVQDVTQAVAVEHSFANKPWYHYRLVAQVPR
jgi:hypothetical protein